MGHPLDIYYSISEMKDGQNRWMVRLKASLGSPRFQKRCATKKEAQKVGQDEARVRINDQHLRVKEVTPDDLVALNQSKLICHQVEEEFGSSDPLAKHQGKLKPDKLAEYGEQLIRLAAPMVNGNPSVTLHDAVRVMDDAIKKHLECGKIPTFNEIRDEFLAGQTQKVTRQTKSSREKHLRWILEKVGEVKVDQGCDILEREIAAKVEAGDWGEHYQFQIADMAKRIGKWLTAEEQGILSKNPYTKLVKMFPKPTDEDVKLYSPQEIERLFMFLFENERYHRLIPYFSLSTFGTFRASDLVHNKGVDRAVRRFNYCQLVDESDLKGKYDDLLVWTPKMAKRQDRNGEWIEHRAGKTNDRYSSLAPNGLAFIKYYWNELQDREVPTADKAYYETRLGFSNDDERESHTKFYMWNRINLTKKRNGFRHTICSMNYAKHHALDYFTEKSGHSIEKFRKSYLNARLATPAKAEEFFKITPEHILNLINKTSHKKAAA